MTDLLMNAWPGRIPHPEEREHLLLLKIANDAVGRWWEATLELRRVTLEKWAKESLGGEK